MVPQGQEHLQVGTVVVQGGHYLLPHYLLVLEEGQLEIRLQMMPQFRFLWAMQKMETTYLDLGVVLAARILNIDQKLGIHICRVRH